MFDGPLAPVPCASQTAYVRCADCPNEAVCGVHLAMRAVRDATARVLDGTSFGRLRAKWRRHRHVHNDDSTDNSCTQVIRKPAYVASISLPIYSIN